MDAECEYLDQGIHVGMGFGDQNTTPKFHHGDKFHLTLSQNSVKNDTALEGFQKPPFLVLICTTDATIWCRIIESGQIGRRGRRLLWTYG